MIELDGIKGENGFDEDGFPTLFIYKDSIPEEGIKVGLLFVMSGLCKSKGEARRLIEQGGAYISKRGH